MNSAGMSEVFVNAKYVSELERREALLVVDEPGKVGIVLDYNLSTHFNVCYVRRMSTFSRRYGLRRYFDTCFRSPRFAREHNANEELLNLCLRVRTVINYRRALHTSAEITTGHTDAQFVPLEDHTPIFITFMNADLTAPMSIGYQVGNNLVLEIPGDQK